MQPTILITGATDGIGKALASAYQASGARLILVGRRSLDRLDNPIAKGHALFTASSYCQADLSDSMSSADKISQFLNEQGIEQLDLLIHNAGVGYYGLPEQQSAESIKELMAVNLLAPLAISHKLIPRLMGGKIVFISSVSSALPTPNYAVYSATKAALDGLARNLRVELQESTACPAGLAVQVIHPGATRTAMHAKSGISKDVMDWERFPSAEDVASKIIKAIDSGKPSVTIGLSNRLLRFGGLYLGGLVDWLVRRRQR